MEEVRRRDERWMQQQMQQMRQIRDAWRNEQQAQQQQDVEEEERLYRQREEARRDARLEEITITHQDRLLRPIKHREMMMLMMTFM